MVFFRLLSFPRYGPHIFHSLFADDSPFFFNGDQDSCHSLNYILRNYYWASGQIINFQKFSVIFSKNSPEDFKLEAAGIFGVPIVDALGKYLELPSDWGISKKKGLMWIKERIASKLSGWKENLLSQAKENVLIKSMVQAISVYAMSIFKFSNYFCK